MQKIHNLIEKLCPNGVEYKPIWSLTAWDKKFNGVDKEKQKNVISYKYYLSTDFAKVERKNGNIKYISTGISGDDRYTTEELAGDYLAEGEVVCIPWGGTPNVKYHKGKFVTGDNRIATSLDTNILSNKFLYYWMQSKINVISKFYRGSGIKHPSMKDVLDMNIALPPLEVQCEIVHILDDFTLLSAELSAELKARQKQYDYYSEKLLNNIETKEISFGDACDVVTDYVAAGSFGDIAKNVQYINTPDYAQLIRTVDIKNNFQKADYIYVSKNAFNYLWRVNLDKECVILPNIGVNCGEVYYLSPKMLKYEKNVLGPNAILVRSNTNNIKYLSYLFKTRCFQKQLRKIISPAGQTKFNKTELKKLILHLPSKEIQENIVEKLDKLDEICNNIYNGLPAEIESRQKQYEYYRDKLLTFKELKVNE